MKTKILKTELQNEEYANLINLQDYEGIAFKLNYQPLVLNSSLPNKVWKSPKLLDFFNTLSLSEVLELYKIPNLISDIRTSVDSKNKDNLIAYLQIVQTLISKESADKIQLILEQTENDPEYQQYIKGDSRAQQLGIYPVSSSDVQGALN